MQQGTPLHCAIWWNQLDTVKLLVHKYKASLTDAIDEVSKYLWYSMYLYQYNFFILQLDELTPMHICARNGCTDIFDWLSENQGLSPTVTSLVYKLSFM